LKAFWIRPGQKTEVEEGVPFLFSFTQTAKQSRAEALSSFAQSGEWAEFRVFFENLAPSLKSE
jgi:hypothetical protein